LEKVLKIMAEISRRAIWIMWQHIKQYSEHFLGKEVSPDCLGEPKKYRRWTHSNGVGEQR